MGNYFYIEKVGVKNTAVTVDTTAKDDDDECTAVQRCNSFGETMYGGDDLPNLPRGQRLLPNSSCRIEKSDVKELPTEEQFPYSSIFLMLRTSKREETTTMIHQAIDRRLAYSPCY